MGRRKENREKLTCYVKRSTKRIIRKSVVKNDREMNTAGKVVDKFAKGGKS